MSVLETYLFTLSPSPLLSPSLSHTQYKVSESELSSRTLWLSVWDWDRFGRNQFLGEMRVPLSSLDLTNTTDQWYTLMDQVRVPPPPPPPLTHTHSSHTHTHTLLLSLTHTHTHTDRMIQRLQTSTEDSFILL